MQGIFDSHAHYDDPRFDADRHELIPAMHRDCVAAIINVGCTPDTIAPTLELADRYPYVYAAVGMHPEVSLTVPDDYLARVREAMAHPKAVAVGEIGLDYHYEDTDRPSQKRMFEEQLDLAEELDLPVIIHSRDAAGDTVGILRSHRNRGVVHCFSGSAETAEEYLSMGYYIGFTGVVTFSNARKIPDVVRAVPLDRLLLETDCPYLAPEPFRGSRCSSDLIVHTAAKIAALKGMDPQELIDLARENTCRLFGINL